jgi:hypothetical protein
MMFSATLMVRRIPRPKLTRVGVLMEIKLDMEAIKTRSSRKTSNLHVSMVMS